ncbi:MAG: hypothetical protein J0L92_09945 [Deltaproteobacteria bacterium]|nr:hypothetical protein [Deltaproteobacteria bacterium]
MRSSLFVSLLVSLAGLSACGPGVDRQGSLTRLRSAIDAEVADAVVLEDHNQLAEDVSNSGALEGMFQHELSEALGRGTNCGVNELCARHDFRATDWVYEIGHAPGDPELSAGPTLIVGFDSTGRVDRTFYLTRRTPAAAR